MANSEIGEKECPVCKGTGEIIGDCQYGDLCRKCKGKGTLDWIENIVGVSGTYIKPGVYIREVDYSVLMPSCEEYKVKRMRRL